MEEMCERRIEMLTKSMKKARKKRKLDRLESEDDVSNVLYQVEKARVKVCFRASQGNLSVFRASQGNLNVSLSFLNHTFRMDFW